MSNVEEELSLFMRGYHLPKLDRLSESDPFVVVSFKTQGGWEEIFRSITLQNQKNPQWPEPCVVKFRFEEFQEIRFDVYDRDTPDDSLEKQQFIGYFETTLGKIIGSNKNTIKSKLLNIEGKSIAKGKFAVTGEKTHSTKDVLKFKFSAKKLLKKNLMGLIKSDPFYRISLSSAQTATPPVPVFESEHKTRTSNPSWKEQQLPLRRICNGDLKRDVRIEVYDWEGSGKHQFIGVFISTITEMLERKEFNLMNFKSKKKSGSFGKLFIDSMEIIRQPSFFEYINGGIELKLSVAVDFSTKNGVKDDPISLHHIPAEENSEELNDYQIALKSVGQILQDYDTDQMLGAFGFGGKLNGKSMRDGYFLLDAVEAQPEVQGLKGILESYANCANAVIPSDKTCLAPVIREMISSCGPATKDNRTYSVLLVLTCGIVDDFDETLEAIIEASAFPMSIVIVGVGNSDFSQMVHLDGDNSKHLVSKTGKESARDIVQFVPFQETVEKGYAALAQETLEELPEQVEQYMWFNNILPDTPSS